MPPKRKPVQKETKAGEAVAAETALVSLENNEEVVENVEKGVDDAVEDIQGASKKAASKKTKKPNNHLKASELKGEVKEQSPDKDDGKENVESTKKEEDNLVGKEKPPRRGAKRGHPVEKAPSTHESELKKEEKEQSPEKNDGKETVETTKKDEDNLVGKEKPPRRGAKRGLPVEVAPSTHESELKKEEKEQSPEKNDGKETVETTKKDEDNLVGKEKPPRRGAKRGHPVEVAPSTHEVQFTLQESELKEEEMEQRTGETVETAKKDEDNLVGKEKPPRRGAKRGHPLEVAPSTHESQQAAEAEPSRTRRGGQKNAQDLEDKVSSEEHPENHNESPVKKRGGKKKVQESEQEVESSKTGRGDQQNAQDDEDVGSAEGHPEDQNEPLRKKRGGKKNVQETEVVGNAEEHPQAQIESPKKKRGGKKNVQEPKTEAEAPKTRRGGPKNVQAAKEVAKEDHELSDDGPSEPVQEEAGAGKRGGRKAKVEQPSKKNGAEPEEKKSKKEEEEPTDFGCEKENKKGEKWNLKISTWNIAGLRAWVKKNGLDFLKEEDADIICFQETKCPEKKVPAEAQVDGYHKYWVNGVKDGYAGVALYSKEKPLSVSYGLNNEVHDEEGRVITAEYEKFYLVTTYVPNSGQGLKTLPKRMEWDKIFLSYLKELDAKKPVILCGDLNVAHQEIDLANPKTNTKSAGFTKEERENMTALLKEGFVDSFRQLYPEKTGCYTFWTYMGNARSRNTGWRLDYFVLSERLMDQVCDVTIRNKVLGSDHCPVTLFIHV
ncbi:hypothetical protein GE061_019053 [Apolygus lucorum]|uniref:DNA-(apurinic or apyrimidinic site) endonuclease n=1 Tax=Apolygus lucorum TaxID=248454 RepID=A0A6A4JTV2_APOLU|nr:hypothetical protein GE061_019053 [Apolygus lucorum]